MRYTEENYYLHQSFPDIKRRITPFTMHTPVTLNTCSFRSTFPTHSTPLRLLVILDPLRRPLFELLSLLVHLLNRLTNLALLLPRLDSNGNVTGCALVGGFLDSAFGVFPVCGSGTDFVSVELELVDV
jgi:hypothetical protein